MLLSTVSRCTVVYMTLMVALEREGHNLSNIFEHIAHQTSPLAGKVDLYGEAVAENG